MNVVLFHSNSFLEHQDNPRLPKYKQLLELKGHAVEYKFLTNTGQHGGLIQKSLEALILATKYLFSKEKTDLFYFYSSNILFLPLYLSAKIRGIQMVFEKTELDSIRPDRGLKDKLVNVSYWLDEKLAHWFCDRMVVISPKLALHYEAQVKAIHICPAFTDTSLAFETPLSNLNCIGYLGSFGSKDNVEDIISAFLLAQKTRPELRLKLMGNAPIHLVEKYGFEIEFTGLIPGHELYHNLYECDLLVSNRRKTPYSEYGSPTKLVEYLATGIPVVSTSVGSYSPKLENEVHLRFIQANDPEFLSKCMLDRYENIEQFNLMGLRGRGFCRTEMDNKHIVEGWYQFIKQ
jgi:glycosyltransferase involved in cell wall biosynthesis